MSPTRSSLAHSPFGNRLERINCLQHLKSFLSISEYSFGFFSLKIYIQIYYIRIFILLFLNIVFITISGKLDFSFSGSARTIKAVVCEVECEMFNMIYVKNRIF